MKSFFAHGKILLCGEYAVLKGIESLALPVKQGQWMQVWEQAGPDRKKIVWESTDFKGEKWFTAEFDLEDLLDTKTSNSVVSGRISQLLIAARKQNNRFLKGTSFARVELNSDFDRNWGLGSSSSLVALLAKWANADPQALQKEVFGGSGYDSAVSHIGKPIIYWLESGAPNWAPWYLNPDFTEDWYLMFPGQKANSREAISKVRDKIDALAAEPFMMAQLNQILGSLKNPKTKVVLEAGLEMWQALIAGALELPRVYDDLGIQPVKGGLCKYLGAWGGDVILVNETMLKAWPKAFAKMDFRMWNEFVINK